MTRCKITTYVTPDIAEMLKRVAATDNISMSDIVEDAIVRRLTPTSHGAEQAAIIAGLGKVSRRLAAVERNLETHFELSAQFARFMLSVIPEIPEADWPSCGGRGRDRLNRMLSVVIARIAGGRSTLQDTYNTPEREAGPAAVQPEAAQ